MSSTFNLNHFKRRMYNWTIEIVKTVDTMPSGIAARRLGDQFIRSGTSILANYIEAQHAGTKKEFIRYLSIAPRSGNESKLWLSLLHDAEKIPTAQFKLLFDELLVFCKIIAAAIISARKSLQQESKINNH